jgi:prepilin-type N-terminal cleavage/methylation domain-containing protein
MKSERGVSLIEVIIAVAILGIISAAFLGALSTASKAMFVADERATAESLARSQMEYVKNQEYDADWNYTVSALSRSWSEQPFWWDALNPPLLSSDYTRYSAEASADEDDDNPGIQKITVTITHGEEVITLEGYKVDR